MMERARVDFPEPDLPVMSIRKVWPLNCSYTNRLFFDPSWGFEVFFGQSGIFHLHNRGGNHLLA